MNLYEEIANIEDVQDLINFLETVIDRNYYLGDVWSDSYNKNGELENKIFEIISNENYINYLVEYCDTKGDIFIIKDSKELIERETEENPVGDWFMDEFHELQTLEEFEKYIYLDESETIDLIDEVMGINSKLSYYIDYNKIIRDMALNGELNEWGDGVIIRN